MTRAELLTLAQFLYETDGNRVKPTWADLGDGIQGVWIDKAKIGLKATITNEKLRKFWRAMGGEFHGPNVETGTMPEAKLLPLLRVLTFKG